MDNYATRSLLWRHYWSYLTTKVHCLNVLLEVSFIFYRTGLFIWWGWALNHFLLVCFSPISNSLSCNYSPSGCAMASLKARGVERYLYAESLVSYSVPLRKRYGFLFWWKQYFKVLWHTHILLINWDEYNQKVNSIFFIENDFCWIWLVNPVCYFTEWKLTLPEFFQGLRLQIHVQLSNV